MIRGPLHAGALSVDPWQASGGGGRPRRGALDTRCYGRGSKEGSKEGGPGAKGAGGSGSENKNFWGGPLERAGGTEPEKLHVPAAACAVSGERGGGAGEVGRGARGDVFEARDHALCVMKSDHIDCLANFRLRGP